MVYNTETLDKLYLELSQFTQAKTRRELELEAALTAAASNKLGPNAPDAIVLPESESSKLAEIDERWSGTLPQVQFSGAVKKDIDTLRSIIDSLKAEKESIRTKFPWHRGDKGPDVPVLQPRYDALLTEVKRLQAENKMLRAWQDLAFELLSEIRQWVAPGSITDLQAPAALRALMNDRETRGTTIAQLEQEREAAASNMRDEIVKRVREKARKIRSGVQVYGFTEDKAAAIDELATELEAIEVKDDPYPCPRCGAPDTANLATPPEVSIGCRECGWEAVTIKEQSK